MARYNSSINSVAGASVRLAIARKIVLAHGGKIEVTSTLGEGTEFTVSLPAGVP